MSFMSKKEKITARRYANILLISIIILIILSVALVIRLLTDPLYSFLFIFALALTYIMIRYFLIRLFSNWNKGAKGEEKIAAELKKLGNQYLVFNDIVLPGNKGNIDHMVFGKNGIFVIETKNYRGHIFCNKDTWYSHYKGGLKIGRRGGIYWKETRDYNIRSPSKQIKRNAIVLRNFLKDNYPKLSHVWINCIVVFTNENSILEINEPTVAILKTEEIVDYIMSNKTNTDFSVKDSSEIKRIFQEIKQK